MKKLFLFLTALLAVSVTLRAEELQLPHITVVGTAVAEVVPDEMVLSMQVRIVRSSPEDAAREQANSVAEVLKLLKLLKIQDKNIQTSRMEFGENEEYKNDSYVKTGYYAQTDVSFKLKDFPKYHQLWIALTKISGVSVKSTAYDDSKRIEHRKETRTKALEAAREKAAEMAKVLGAQIQEPLEIEEELWDNQWWSGSNAVAFRNTRMVVENPNVREDGTIALGTIPIQIRVKVTFRLLVTQK
jgi:hypothetical protein